MFRPINNSTLKKFAVDASFEKGCQGLVFSLNEAVVLGTDAYCPFHKRFKEKVARDALFALKSFM